MDLSQQAGSSVFVKCCETAFGKEGSNLPFAALAPFNAKGWGEYSAPFFMRRHSEQVEKLARPDLCQSLSCDCEISDRDLSKSFSNQKEYLACVLF